MSARHQSRFGRLGRDRPRLDAAVATPVSETLQAARERKGVDLYRAERDTKIRMRYLQALEDGDWDELPAPVYTKGFLRNYSIYLGLDPDDVLDRWRDEMEQMRTATRVAVTPPPMPLAEPGGRRLTLSPSMIVGGLLIFVIVLFIGFIGLQFVRFLDVPVVTLTYPPNVVYEIDAQQITLQGTAGRGAIVAITGSSDGQLYTTTADEAGKWSREVPLNRGTNKFSATATDQVTQRESTALPFTITVPLPIASPGATATIAPPPPITMTLFGPAAGFTTTDPGVTVSGTTTGTRITIVTTYMGSPEPTPLATSGPVQSPGASVPPSAPPAGPGADITVAGGSFSQSLTFPVGQWRLTVTSYATGITPVAQDVEILVQPPQVDLLNLNLYIAGNRVTLKVSADGVAVQSLDGVAVNDKDQFTVTAVREFCVRTNKPGSVSATLDGVELGLLASSASGPANFIIKPGQSPQPASSPC